MTRRSSRNSAFGAAVNDLLAERGMTQSDLAEGLGKSTAYTNQTMTGRKGASPQWVNLVAQTLNLSDEHKKSLHIAAAKDHGYQIDLGEYPPKRKR